ncbi:2-hydroxyacid dehydrogenase [Roseibium aquae]
MLPVVTRQLTERFEVILPFNDIDPDAIVQAAAPRVQGLAVMGTPIDARYIERFPKLEIVANFGVGYDNVAVYDCSARDVVVTHTPDVLSDEVADIAIGLLIMTVRQLGAAERWVRDRNWLQKGSFPLTPGTLRGRTLGIFGLGRIGKAIARRAEAFDLKIRYHGRSPQADVPYPYHADLEDLAAACDTLMIAAPGTAETRHAVSEGVLHALGPHGVVINIGRGSVIDEAALIDALETDRIMGAGLDVFADEPFVPRPLLIRDNVVTLPHVGSASVHTRNAMGQLVVDNLVSWFEKGEAVTPVPETPITRRP